MIGNWESTSKTSQTASPVEGAIPAHTIMAKDEADKKDMKKDFDPGAKGKTTKALFTPDELDIYVNKITLEAYIFHGKDVDYEAIEYLEYNPADYSVEVVNIDGTRLDLGVKIQWLVRPHFTKAEEINIVQTKDGESINGTVVPLKHKDQDD